MEKAKVYFTKEITPQAVVRMYEAMGVKLPGRVAVKLHSGEVGNQNFLRPDFLAPMVAHVEGTIVECNTAYEGKRDTTEAHWETMKLHGWTDIAKVDILDEEGEIELAIPEGQKIRKNYVGKHIENYDSLLVLSHFKGHAMGGFGGAVKNMSIGIASSNGKSYIHSGGKIATPDSLWTNLADQDIFLESMAEAAKAVADHCGDSILYISVANNLSVDCDCDASPEDPQMHDIGILASLDPVALDKACTDLVRNSDDPGKVHLIERIDSRHGMHTLEHAEKIGLGSQTYKLVTLD